MTILNKALTRPAALWGPACPLLFTLCILTPAAVWSRFTGFSCFHTCLYRAETAGKRGHSFL